jgi:hypothetical protein
MKKESELQKEIIEFLKSNGWFVIRNHTQGIRYTKGRGTNPNKGIPDLLAVKDDNYVWIEVKTLEGIVSVYQIAWIKNVRNYGANVLIADCVDDVREYIRGFEG